MLSEIVELVIHLPIIDEIIKIFQIFFSLLIILYEIKKKCTHLFIVFLGGEQVIVGAMWLEEL